MDVGFNYVLFQPDPNRDRVKAWIDGEEYFTFFSIKEFLSFVTNELKPAMTNVLREYSFFLWDVIERRIARVRLVEQATSIKEQLAYSEIIFDGATQDIAENYWKSQASDDGLAVKVRN